MLLSVSKVFVLLLISMSVLVIGQFIGPMSKLPEIFLVDENYFQITRNHFIFLGITTSIAILIGGIILKTPLRISILVLFVSGVLQCTAMQIGDPDFSEYYFSSLAEFLMPYCASAAIILILFLALREIVKRARTP